MNLTHIQVGYLVAVPTFHANRWTRTPQIEHEIYRVTKRTETQAQAETLTGRATIRIRVADGKVIGENYKRAIEATPELVARHEAQIEHRKRHLVAERKLEDLEQALLRRMLTTVQLEAIAEAWEQVKAMGPKEAA